MHDRIIIRKGDASDAEDFSRLALHSAPRYLLSLFGFRARSIIAELFRRNNTTFSFKYSYFIEFDGEVAGMALVHSYRARKNLIGYLPVMKHLRLNIFVRLGSLFKAARETGRISETEHYLSSIAVYPKYRGRGLGRALLQKVECDIRNSGGRRVVLRAEIDNDRAIRLYKNSGYNIGHKTSPFKMRGRSFQFFRMTKEMDFN